MTDDAFKPERLASPTGADLCVYTREADGAARGIVHINHGLAERAARYARFANYLASRGYHVIAHDHRGHGLTTAEDGAPRRFADTDGWSKVMGDVKAVGDEAKRRWPGLTLVVFGHSMGSVVAVNHALREPDSIAGLAAWNGNMALGGLKSVMRFVLWCEALVGGPFTPSTTIDKLTFKAWNKRFPEGRTDADWLSSDPAEVDAYVADELCGWPSSVSLWRDFLGGVAFAEDDGNLEKLPKDLPVHLIGGSLDPATEGGKTVQHLGARMERLGMTHVTLKVLEGYRHETVNEVGRDAAMADFANWLDSVCPAKT